ncbi:MAG: replication-associated recombination protein A [Oscillospiraceae bacterium]|nr:replication-associated recombination protein A [Oscillospiraceae bacterium]
MNIPLPERIRPDSLDDVAGQSHILSEGKALRRIIESGNIPNMIFYGSSGTGKTTVARIAAKKAGKRLHKLNGTTMSIADIRAVAGETETLLGCEGILLYIDEIQYLNKKQQQSLLEYIENGSITLIASTTENPYFYIYNAVLSRSTVFEFKPIETSDIVKVVERGISTLSTEMQIPIDCGESVINIIASSCGGDARKALTAAELCVLSAEICDGRKVITPELAAELTQRSSLRFDRSGDENYDLMSALQKSIRGSDPDAAVYYLARLLESGDIISPCRRLLVIACEDIGLAYPGAIPIVKSCVDTAVQLGLPEARIPLANAAILLATSPKSNTAYVAVDTAIADIKSGLTGEIPRHLQNVHCDGEGNQITGQNYLYPHDYPKGYVKQDYLPESVRGKQYYKYGSNKNEQAAKEYWGLVKKM